MILEGVDQTIFALASGAGKSGVAVFRVSGSNASTVLGVLTKKSLPLPRCATLMPLADPVSGDVLDDCLVTYFPGPKSFTGEDIVEFHVHGGQVVISAIAETLSGQKGVRLAEPGEFTRRAFENGKLDLTAAEGLADLINAETSAQRRQATRQLRGELGTMYDRWRPHLLRASAFLEAEIDFVDEDLPTGINENVVTEIERIYKEIVKHLDDGNQGEILRQGVYITIVGPPNAGKSTLLNRLSSRDVAIVSEQAGTTRDVIEVHLELGGYPVIIADTAGLREATDAVENEGVRRAEERAKQADLKLVVFDGGAWPEKDVKTFDLIDSNAIVVINKSDLIETPQSDYLQVSALSGEGFNRLLEILKREVSSRCCLSASPALTRLRHRTALESCADSLQRFKTVKGVELKAEDLRQAARSLGKITGRVDVEEVLDVIFREFCIGK